MTATILESTVVETVELEDDKEINHIVCHCKNDVVSWCGLDVSELPILDNPWHEDDDPMCSFCVAVLYSFKSCPWGCHCPECIYVDD